MLEVSNDAPSLARTTAAFCRFEDPGAYAARLAWGIEHGSVETGDTPLSQRVARMDPASLMEIRPVFAFGSSAGAASELRHNLHCR
jgi:hypothetical protein